MTSLRPSLQIMEQPRKEAKTAISNALLRLASLYQISGFAEDNSFVLADWILDNMKHRKIETVLDALKNPPILYENGAVLRNWRLNPDTIHAWVDKKATEAESLAQEQRSKEALDKASKPSDLSPEVTEMIKKCMDELQKDMFKPGFRREMSPDLKRIDFMLKLLRQYRKENFDPITGKPNNNLTDEAVWLFDKGYEIKDGELKEI